jgi:hypothetical protein
MAPLLKLWILFNLKKGIKASVFFIAVETCKSSNYKELVEFYVTCIRPDLTYACEVFNFNLQDKLKSSLE